MRREKARAAGSPGPGVMLPYPRSPRLLFLLNLLSYYTSRFLRSAIGDCSNSGHMAPACDAAHLTKFSDGGEEQTFLGRLFCEDKRKQAATTFPRDKSEVFPLSYRARDRRTFKEPSVISPFANNLGARRL